MFSIFKINTLRKDKSERDFFRFLRMIPENTTVLDIGANIGIMTVHIAQSVKGVSVHSFEPIPSNITALKRIVKYYNLSNVHIHETALGNTVGEVEMVMPVISAVKMQGLSHVIHKSIADNNKGDLFKVPINKLDNIFDSSKEDTRISAIKIDVENFEFFVLEGGKNMILKNKPIVYAELWENDNRENCMKLFKDLNYTMFAVSQNELVPFDSSIHKTQNFIFTPA